MRSPAGLGARKDGGGSPAANEWPLMTLIHWSRGILQVVSDIHFQDYVHFFLQMVKLIFSK